MIDVERHGEIAEIKISHKNELNPFSIAMTQQLIDLCPELEEDDSVAGILLWGGEGRSFSAGGDFRDLTELKKGSRSEFEEYLRDIVRSYQAILGISKPVVAAVDHHAIGQGFQVALMADWRVGTSRSLYAMPELANGVPCPLGSAILESLLGRSAMLQLVVGCGRLDAQGALEYRLIDEVIPAGDLKSTAVERLTTYCSYPQLAYRLTKKIHNDRLWQALEDVSEPAAKAHSASFHGGQADEHFARILGAGSES